MLPTDPLASSVPDLMEPREEQPPLPSLPTEEEEEEDLEEEEEEEGDSQVQGEQSKESPPPLVPPQPASPNEDKMPPYDEQTQAFIDGEVSRFEREETLPIPYPHHLYLQGSENQAPPAPQQAWESRGILEGASGA